MSEPTGQFEHHGEGTDSTPDVTITGTSPASEGTSSGGHPAWEDFKQGIPSQLHGMIDERLGKWDSGVQDRIGKVHSEYEWAKPFKSFVDQGVNFEQLQQANAFYAALNNDPRATWELLGQHYGFANEYNEQGQPGDELDLDAYDLGDESPGSDEFDIESDPRFQEMRQQVESVQGFIAQQQQAQYDAQASSWIEQTMSTLAAKHGSAFDPQMVSTIAAAKMSAGMHPDQALESAAEDYAAHVNSIRSAPRAGDSAPVILSPGGGSPVAPSTSKLSDKDRRAAGIAMLQAAQAQQ